MKAEFPHSASRLIYMWEKRVIIVGLLTEYVDVKYNGRTSEYYENLGYVFPKRLVQLDPTHKKIVERVKIGATIKVKVSDLIKGSAQKITCECDNCKKIYSMEYRNYLKWKIDDKIYCNNCKNTLFHSGENSYRYNKDLTELEREYGRYHKENREFIRICLNRDEYKCTICNSKEELQVHHLEAYSKYKNLRYDINNGITLCKKCHTRFHSIYGYIDFNKYNFIEFSNIDLNKFLDKEGNITKTKWAYCVEDDEIIYNIKEYATINNLDDSAIYNCCNKKYGYKTVKKKHYVWYENIN